MLTSFTFFMIFIPTLVIILLAVNIIFSPHRPYQQKNSVFECGFDSHLEQTRAQFNISFFIFALLFLLFDLEILLVYPYLVSAYTLGLYGLAFMLVFFSILTLGFAFELGKNALKIDSRQTVMTGSASLSLLLFLPVEINGFVEMLSTNYNLILTFIISIFIVLISLYIMGASFAKKPGFINDGKTTHVIDSEEGMIKQIRKEGDRYNCEHKFKIDPERQKAYDTSKNTPDEYTSDMWPCGYAYPKFYQHLPGMYSSKPCRARHHTMWKCTKCGELRCGQHAKDGFSPNIGWGAKRR